jgi:hypothetical protein
METARILLVGILAALGFMALGLGGFVLSAPSRPTRRAGHPTRVTQRR